MPELPWRINVRNEPDEPWEEWGTNTRRLDISEAQCAAYREALEQIARSQQPGYLGAVTAQRIARAALGPDTACGIPVLGQGRTNFPRRAASITDDPAFDAAPPADPTNRVDIDRDADA